AGEATLGGTKHHFAGAGALPGIYGSRRHVFGLAVELRRLALQLWVAARSPVPAAGLARPLAVPSPGSSAALRAWLGHRDGLPAGTEHELLLPLAAGA